MMKKTFQINGMKCAHCKANVEKAINGISGVSFSEVHLENKDVTVDYDESMVSEQQIKDAVEASGRFEFVG